LFVNLADAKRVRKRPKRSVDVMTDFISEFVEKKEEAAERRHQEKMQSINSLVSVLKDIVKKD